MLSIRRVGPGVWTCGQEGVVRLLLSIPASGFLGSSWTLNSQTVFPSSSPGSSGSRWAQGLSVKCRLIWKSCSSQPRVPGGSFCWQPGSLQKTRSWSQANWVPKDAFRFDVLKHLKWKDIKRMTLGFSPTRHRRERHFYQSRSSEGATVEP